VSSWPTTDRVATAEEARQFVRQVRSAGLDFVKVYSSLSREAYFAIADEARASLRREVNIRSIRPTVWNDPASKDAFLATVRSRPLIELTIKGAHP